MICNQALAATWSRSSRPSVYMNRHPSNLPNINKTMESRQRTEDRLTDRRKRSDTAADEPREPRYHVYIRLPFERGDFVDPGTVNWDEKKSEALWGFISGSSSLENVNWTKLADQFDVTVEFILQMTNYLTERHTSQVRAHMLKATAARGSNAPSPVPGAEPPANHQATTDLPRRISSGASRAPSALSIRKETGTPLPEHEEERRAAGAVGPSIKNALPARPGSSRNSSGNTAVPSQMQQNQPDSRPGTATRLSDPARRRFPYLSTPTAQQQQQPQPQPQQEDEGDTLPSPAASSLSSASSSSDSPVESRIIRRPPRFQSRDPRTGAPPFNDDDDDDEAEPAFLPFKHQAGLSQGTGSSNSGQDLGATLRGNMNMNMRDLAAGRRAAAAAAAAGGGGGDTSQSQSQTSDSSAGSAAVVPRPRPATAGVGGADGRRVPQQQQQQGPLSPRRTAELAARGPGSASRGKGASREGSDGAPSMGSSFSDLDDASVTQSALEEALASRMQDGTIGSRMSVIGGTIGQAIRSRYLPKPNRQ